MEERIFYKITEEVNGLEEKCNNRLKSLNEQLS